MNTRLIQALIDAKAAEDAARERRIDAETELLAELPIHKPEGSTTFKVDDYKVTVTTGVNRRIDSALIEHVRATIPPALFEQAVRWKPEANPAGIRYLQNNEPEVYTVLAQAITATPAKPSVRVEINEPAAKAA